MEHNQPGDNELSALHPAEPTHGHTYLTEKQVSCALASVGNRNTFERNGMDGEMGEPGEETGREEGLLIDWQNQYAREISVGQAQLTSNE